MHLCRFPISETNKTNHRVPSRCLIVLADSCIVLGDTIETWHKTIIWDACALSRLQMPKPGWKAPSIWVTIVVTTTRSICLSPPNHHIRWHACKNWIENVLQYQLSCVLQLETRFSTARATTSSNGSSKWPANLGLGSRGSQIIMMIWWFMMSCHDELGTSPWVVLLILCCHFGLGSTRFNSPPTSKNSE